MLEVWLAMILTLAATGLSGVDGFIRASGTLTRPAAADKTTGRSSCSQHLVRVRPTGVNGVLFVGGGDSPHEETALFGTIWDGVNHAFRKLEKDASAYSMMKFNENFLFNTTASSSG